MSFRQALVEYAENELLVALVGIETATSWRKRLAWMRYASRVDRRLSEITTMSEFEYLRSMTRAEYDAIQATQGQSATSVHPAQLSLF